MEIIKSKIRDVPDFPKPGILFKDITPVLQDPAAFRATIQLANKLGAVVQECAFVIELGFLEGRKKLAPTPVFSLITY